MNMKRKVFAGEPMYRYYATVKNVWDYLTDDFAESIADHNKEISGWCSESGIAVVKEHFKGCKVEFVTEMYYWKEIA